MKKRVLSLLLALSLIFSLATVTGVTVSAATIDSVAPATGDGTANNPYQIGTAGELYWFAQTVNGGTTNANAVLTADITVNTGVLKSDGTVNSGSFTSWTPIGNDSRSYTGTFNGNGKTISGLYFDDGNTKYVGLFGYVGSGGNVSNVGIVDSYFNGKEKVGGVCGYNDGTIENCYSTGAVRGTSIVGGVCGYSGYNNKGTIENCYSTGAVSGTTTVGGVCGYNYNGTIENCYSIGAVSGTRTVGGVCGYNGCDYDGTIKNCYNKGTVNGQYNVGGVGGWNENGTITNCYFDSDNYVGNAVGYIYSGTIKAVADKTTNAFEKGEVCYLLQSGQEKDSGSGEAPMVWGQTIGIDKAPVLTSDSTKTVYKIGATYSNTNSEITETEHNYGADFRCTNCGNYEAPELNENVYEITNASQLYWFAEYVNNGNTSAKAILKENIVVNKNVLGADGKLVSDTSKFVSWTPIGSMSNKYTGTFDGQGHTISGLYFDNGGKQYVGLFGYVGIGGNVSNVGVVASYFNGSDDVGGVCGYNYGTITNCYNTGVVNGSNNVGGVCGRNNSSSKIENCYNTGVVNGSSYVGGVCGCNNVGTIENCYNTGAVNGSSYVGGVCGWNQDGTIKNCYNTGAVEGSANVGGVCGYNNYNTIKNCYNTGVVSGTSAVGGVCGNNNGTIENCYYLDTTASDSVATSKTADEFGSGEVTYLLQSGQTADKNGTIPEVWGQTLTGENKQDYPVLGGAPVYPCTPCTGKYSNTNGATGKHTAPDNYDEYGFGKCKDCNADVYQPATLNNGVYEISNAGQLYWFAEQVNGGNTGINAELTANITVSSGLLSSLVTDESGEVTNGETLRSWTPIGNNSYIYTGTFNGNGFYVSGLYFNETNTAYVGLFGHIGSGGRVSNVGVVDSYFNGNNYVSGVCGYSSSGTIENCYNAGTISGKNKIGGVSGYASATIKNCYNTGTVSGESNVGGVCGEVSYCRIFNCYNTGTVSGTGSNIGSVCGNDYYLVINNCYYLAENETDSIDGTTAKSATQFNSGEVAYLLSQGCTIGEGESAVTYDGAIWGQTINEDDYPKFGGATVYRNEKYDGCVDKKGDAVYSYSNEQIAPIYAEHKDDNENGLCDICGNVMSVSLTLDVKYGGEKMPTGFTVEPDGVMASEFAVDSEDSTIKADTAYTFTSKLTAVSGKFVENPSFNVNGETVTATKNVDGSYTVTYKFTTNDDLTVTANMVAGAAIRLTNGNGLRFYTLVDSAKISKLQALGATVELGTLIAPKNLLGNDDLTFDLDESKYINVKYEAIQNGAYYWHKDVDGQIAGSIVNIKESNTSFSTANGNIARDFVGRGYVKVTLNGTTVITYADYAEGNIENNTRSLAYVAQALKDDTTKYNALDSDVKSLVNNWASKLPTK